MKMTAEQKIDDLDLSYSGLVDAIQSDKNEANRLLKIICVGIEQNLSTIKRIEAELKVAKSNHNYYISGIEKICKHVGYQQPITFVFDETIYCINDDKKFTTFSVTNQSE